MSLDVIGRYWMLLEVIASEEDLLVEGIVSHVLSAEEKCRLVQEVDVPQRPATGQSALRPFVSILG